MLGLFKKKEPVIESKPVDIVCPYCFKKSRHDEVHFRMPKAGGKYKAEVDKLYNNWCDQYKLYDFLGQEKNPAVSASDPDIQNKRYTKNGLLIEVTDPLGNETSERLCRNCHNILPHTAGRTPIVIISVIGTTSCGKTVYLSSLINQLLNHDTAINFGASAMPVSQEIDYIYQKNYYNPLFVQNKMPQATDLDLQFPLIFTLDFKDKTKQSITLCFFDVAGENVVNKNALDTVARNIQNSDGLLFLVDPTKLESIRAKMALNSKEEIDLSVREKSPSDVILALYENFIAKEDSLATNKPTAVVLTKSDLLETLVDESGQYLKKNSNIFNNVIHKGYFNETEYQNINGEIQQFVNKVDRNFGNRFENYFNKRGYFAVSALGTNPDDLNGVITPKRIDEPLLWILHQKGIIKGEPRG
ncbi:GTPase domain-containing protein [Mesobacillus jeotgali]|uniref:GTPase domain-containing protein n=1 Tax=Mesobacillus jeotgali TaxID=129985 RepID=UPI001CFDF3EC|nr:GTPase domain-containing protein [Mesobacillus jeotgali]